MLFSFKKVERQCQYYVIVKTANILVRNYITRELVIITSRMKKNIVLRKKAVTVADPKIC
jgi:hypothetical protein